MIKVNCLKLIEDCRKALQFIESRQKQNLDIRTEKIMNQKKYWLFGKYTEEEAKQIAQKEITLYDFEFGQASHNLISQLLMAALYNVIDENFVITTEEAAIINSLLVLRKGETSEN